jgi:hypothetical protein
MKIIKHYWANKEEEIKSESEFKEYISSQEIKKVFIGFKEIKNFKIEIESERMIFRYGLTNNSKQKYYCNFLNHSIALNNEKAVFLQDINWQCYKTQKLNENTIKLLK